MAPGRRGLRAIVLTLLSVCCLILCVQSESTADVPKTSLSCEKGHSDCLESCEGLNCAAKCTNQLNICEMSTKVGTWLLSEGLLHTASAHNGVALEDSCSNCYSVCGGVGVPSCFLHCKPICESPSKIAEASAMKAGEKEEDAGHSEALTPMTASNQAEEISRQAQPDGVALEDSCSNCHAVCGGVDIPSCFLHCQKICESPSKETQQAPAFLRGATV